MIVAVIGTGNIGMRHLAALKKVPDLLPIAVPIRPHRVRVLTEAGHVSVADIREAVRMGASMSIVATDTGRHAQDALSAVDNGLDVLVEKPLSVDSLSAHQLCARADQLQRKLFVGCVLRFSKSLNKFRRLLKTIGQIHSVRIEYHSFLPGWRPQRPYQETYSARSREGGVLLDLIHEIDYAGWLFGWPRAVQASLRNLGRLGIASDEAADLMWETPEGCLVSVSLDYLTQPPRRRIIASGVSGTLEWNGIDGVVTLALADETCRILRSTQTVDEMLFLQDRSFVESHGCYDPCLTTGQDGVRALAVCDAARRAAKTKREEMVDYP